MSAAACSGGGSGGALPHATAAPTATAATAKPGATATPTAAPTGSAAAYPQTNGDTFAYAGTMTQTFQSFPELTPPGASPAPEPTSATVRNVTQRITIVGNQSFGTQAGLTDVRSQETDADRNGLETTTSTTDSYETIAPVGSTTRLLAYGSKYVDESGDSLTTTPSAATILDELPDTAGAQWTNSPAASIQEALAGDASGSPITVQRTIADDGTYAEKTTYPPNYSATGYTGVGEIQENADGSGSFGFVSVGTPITLDFSRPVPQASGSPLITITVYDQLDPTPADMPLQIEQLASWYGASPTFYEESDRDVGVQTIPASCGLSSAYPAHANEIVQTIDRLDTVIGTTESETTTNFVSSGYGVLCSMLSDTLTLDYDYNGDQPYLFTATPPLEIVTASETLALQPGATIAQGARHSAAAALRAHFDFAFSAYRHERELRIERRAQSFGKRGSR